MARGSLDLGLLHDGGQAVAFAQFQHVHQALVQALVAVVGAQVARLGQGLGRVQPLDQVPGREVEEHAAGHFAAAGAGVAVAQQRHELGQVEPVVEVRAADVHAAGGQDVVAAVAAAGLLGPQAHDGEVGGTAADVHHQHHGFLREALLVVQRGGDGLHLEIHFAQACGARGVGQGLLGLAVALGMVIHEVHGPAQHHALGQAPVQRGTRPVGHAAKEQSDHILVADQLVVHGRLFLQQRAAQQALERAHEPARLAIQVLGHGVAPEMRAVLIRMEEQRRGHAAGIAFQRQQACGLAGHAPGHGGVGGTEIYAQRGRRGSSRHGKRRRATAACEGCSGCNENAHRSGHGCQRGAILSPAHCA